MADISIPGLNSKYNTTELVQGLVEVEKVKLTEMEDSVKEMESRKQIWQNLNRKISTLRASSKKLFGFENPFNEKTVESSDERLLTATATREATEQELSFRVLETAGADRFLSPSLPDDERVPPGTYSFQVGDKNFSLRYRGGKLSDFAERLEKKSDGLMKITVVRDTSETQVILFESMKTGIENRLQFQEDALSWALDKEILRPSETDMTSIDFRSFAPEGAGGKESPLLLFEEDAVTLQPGGRLSLNLPFPAAVEEGMFLEYDLSVREIDPSEFTAAPPPEPVLPSAPPASFKGVVVDSFGSEAALPEWEQPEPPPVVTDGRLGTFETAAGPREFPLLPEDGGTRTVRIPLTDLDQTIRSMEFENRNTYREVSLSSMRITDPRTADGYQPTNPLSTARNARMEFSGIEIERETNSIDDLVPGITLNLNRADPDKEIDISIEPDIEASKDEIIKFVYNYNQTMTQILILSSDNTDIVNEIEYFTDEEREKAFEELGTFRGDITLMQLKNRMQRITSSPYPTSLERDLSMLSQIGISTNASGSGGSSISAGKLRGYLEINEEVLNQALQDKSAAIRELFGKDTDGDLVIDRGVGYEMDRFLNPYVQTGGILTNKVTLIDSQIDRTNDDIEDYKEYLADYEADLKRKYGTMEGMLNQLESSSNALDNFSNQQNNSR